MPSYWVVQHSTLTGEISFCGRWQLIQRLTLVKKKNTQTMRQSCSALNGMVIVYPIFKCVGVIKTEARKFVRSRACNWLLWKKKKLFPDLTESLNMLTQCLHSMNKACTTSSQPEFWHGLGSSSESHTPGWHAISHWWLLGKGDSVSLGIQLW